MRTLGDGARTLLLLHGLAGSNRYFGAAYDSLASAARLVVPDLLGFGGSPRPDAARYDAEAHASALLSVLDTLEARRDVWIVGHSAGALAALALAVRAPDRVRGILAISPPLYRDGADARRHIAALGLQVRLFASGGWLARAMCHWMCHHRERAARLSEWLNPGLPAPIARDVVQHSWISYSRTLENLVLAGSGLRDLERTHAAVRILVGSGDPVLDHALLEDLAARRENVTLERLPGGHQLPLETPDVVVDRVGAWLSRESGPSSSERSS